MNILVYDIAAEDGGGLFILKQFYDEVKEKPNSNTNWIFLVSVDSIKSSKEDNIEVINYPAAKKSYFHRFIFEFFTVKKILKKYNIDLVVSLQNMAIPNCDVRQFVYLHQSLQYCPKRFSFFKKEEIKLAIKQKIVCSIYKHYLKNAEYIFTQTEWIKEATLKWLNLVDNKIIKVPVKIINPSYTNIELKEVNTFFYPARPELYKNHDVIIEATKLLVKRGITDFKVVFTFEKDQNFYSHRLYEKAKKLPIEFSGTLKREDVYSYYQSSILLFPSYLETCGLPLLEARSVGSYILAADLPFAREALDDYPNKSFFDYDDPINLGELMIEALHLSSRIDVVFCNSEKEKTLVETILDCM